MNKDQLNQIINGSFSQLQAEIAESLKQLFNNDAELELNTADEISLPKIFEENPTQVSIYFTTSTESYQYGHLILISPAFAAQLYAWMIGDTPTESITDDHLEGLKEATDQVFGRVKMALAGEGSPSIDDFSILQTESIANIEQFTKDHDGVTNGVNITFPESNFQAIYHLIPIRVAEDTGQIAEVDEDINIQPVEFETLPGKSVSNNTSKNIDMLMDVEMEVTVELGRKKSLISDVLKLGKGSILELEKSAGENLDILINGKKLAEGEVVVIDEHFGIRITQLISPEDRIRLLK